MSFLEDRTAWRGKTLYAANREKIGTISDVYLDEQTGQPEWALVHTGLFGVKQTFVPLVEGRVARNRVMVPYDRSLIEDGPGVEADDVLSQQEEAKLYRHYGFEYVEPRSDIGLSVTAEPSYVAGRADDAGAAPSVPARSGRRPVQTDVSDRETDDAITRSEEELTIGTTERETGRVRLRKHVVVDEVTTTVPVRREEIRVERMPITADNVSAAQDGLALSEEEHEVVLYEEEAVVEKRVVPKERVRLYKESHVDELSVSEQVRKEEIEVDEGVTGRMHNERP